MKNILLALAGLVVCTFVLTVLDPLVKKDEDIPEPPALPDFCEDDPQCAIGGCSGQVCGLKGEVEDIITTCEWRPEYECLKETCCVFEDGECRWAETDAYLDCMKRLGE